MSRITRAEFAALMGVHKSAVTRWVQAGRITLGDDGLLDPADAARQLSRTGSPLPHHQARAQQIIEEKAAKAAQPAAAARNGTQLPLQMPEPAAAEPAGDDLDEGGHEYTALRLKRARVAREEADAAIAAMKRDEQAKLLIRRADAEAVMADFGRTVGALLDRMPHSLTAELLACMGDQHRIHTTLTDAARDLRTEIAAHMRRKAQEQLDINPEATP